MSTQYRNGHEVPDKVLIKRLKELSNAINKGEKSFSSEFTMRVPAEMDRDADLVLQEAARRLQKSTEITCAECGKDLGPDRRHCSEGCCEMADGEGPRNGEDCSSDDRRDENNCFRISSDEAQY